MAKPFIFTLYNVDNMINPTSVQLIAAVLFALAVIHTFSTKYFEHLAHTQPRYAGIWHLLGEVEVVFGFLGHGVDTVYICCEWQARSDYLS